MTLGLTFLSLMSAYWWKNLNLNFKKRRSLALRNTLKRNPKVISNQNLFNRFQLWCWFWCWSWCLTAGLGYCSPNQSESDQISPEPPPFPHQIFTLLLLEVGVLLLPYHMQKTNFITQLIVEIKLTYYLLSLWACSGRPEHNHFETVN